MYEIWHWPVLLETTVIVGLFMTALICGIKRMERQAERDYPLPARHGPAAWRPEYERVSARLMAERQRQHRNLPAPNYQLTNVG